LVVEPDVTLQAAKGWEGGITRSPLLFGGKELEWLISEGNCQPNAERGLTAVPDVKCPPPCIRSKSASPRAFSTFSSSLHQFHQGLSSWGFLKRWGFLKCASFFPPPFPLPGDILPPA